MSDLKASLQAQIKGKVFTPEDAEYDEKSKRWASNAEKKAAYIALVESPEDISKTVAPKHLIAVTVDPVCNGEWVGFGY